MNPQEFNQAIDMQLSTTGAVDKELFTKFVEAYRYDSASTAGWLETKLKILKNRISSGQFITLFVPGQDDPIRINKIPEFLSWIQSHFPGSTLP
jgi:hypothetical protein